MSLPPGAIQVIVAAFVAAPLAIVTVLLRIWSKYLQNQRLAAHDYLAIAALVLAVGCDAIFAAAALSAGLGEHLVDVLAADPAKLTLHMKLFVPAQLLWAAANSCVKFSILSLYTVLFPNNRFCKICYATIAATTAYFFMVLLEAFLLCRPVQFNWDKSIPGGTCSGENAAYLVAGITNLAIDVFIVVLPMPLVFGLQMSMSRKVIVVGMFGLGGLICIISLLRVIWLHTWDLTDLTFTETPGSIYSILEPTLGVINACLPTIRPAVSKVSGRSRSLIFGSSAAAAAAAASSSSSSSRFGSKRSWKPHNHEQIVKGQFTRDFERLDDELPLQEVPVAVVISELRVDDYKHSMV